LHTQKENNETHTHKHTQPLTYTQNTTHLRDLHVIRIYVINDNVLLSIFPINIPSDAVMFAMQQAYPQSVSHTGHNGNRTFASRTMPPSPGQTPLYLVGIIYAI